MDHKKLLKALRRRDKEAEIKIDGPLEYRVFVYSQQQKYPITSYIDKRKYLKITKISDYPKQRGHFPICVIRIKRLHISHKRPKPKE